MRLARDQSGSVLIEFALVSLALYLIMAITVEFGRAFLMANITQNAATAAASLISRTTIAKSATTSDELLMDPEVVNTIFNPNFLVVDTGCAPGDGACINAFADSLPEVNKFLFRTTMLQDPNTTVFRYPGAVPTGDTSNPYGIATVTHDSHGVETTSCCIRVLDAAVVPVSAGRGIRVTLNYPYQAVMLSDFGQPHVIDAAGDESNIFDADGNLGVHRVTGGDLDDSVEAGPYTGEFGLGKQYAFNTAVRPYRRLITMEAVEGVAP